MKKNLTLLLSALFLFCSLIKAQSWSELGGVNGLAAIANIYSICSDASGNIYAAGYFNNSSGNWYVAKYGLTTGINETSTAGIDVSVYPNPGTGEFKVQSLKFKVDRIEIDNVFGNKIYEQTINSDHQTLLVPLFAGNTKLNAGIYFVKLFIGEKSYCRKIIVE